MKTKALIILFSIQTFFVYAQKSEIKGSVLDMISKEPIPFTKVSVSLGSKIFTTTTDLDGGFKLDSLDEGLYSFNLAILGYNDLDTLIQIGGRMNQLNFKLYSKPIVITNLSDVNPKAALQDIKTNEKKLYLPGGFVTPGPLPTDSIFKVKYGITYTSMGCCRFPGDSEESYNRIIFKYLDKKYGKGWRKTVRRDVVGL